MLGAGTGPSLALATPTPTPTPAAASTPTPPSPPAPAPAATSKLKQKQKQKDDDDKMGLSTLPYDLLLNIATYLDLRDVHSLQLTCRSLYDASTTRPVYRKLATDLLRRCRALPLKGFQRLADLSTEALIHAVNKANHYEAAWRVRAPRPIGWGEAEGGGGAGGGGGGDGYDERGVNSHSNYMDVAPGGKLAARLKLEEDAASASSSASSSSSSSLSRSKNTKTKKNKWYKIVSAPPGEEVDWLSPITSSYTLCATKSGKVVCWDVQRDVCLAEWNPGARWELWKCRVEFEERTVFFTMAKVVTGSYDDDRVMNFVLMRLTFSDGPSGESAPTPPVFAHVTEFKTTGVVMNVFLLDPSERLLSAFVWVSTSNTIGLYALLDWAEREYVFVDTGIECVMSSNWSCILFQNNIVIHCEEADAAFQHFYPLALLRAYTSVLPDKEATPVISRRVPPARTLKKRFVFPVFEDTEEEEEMEEAEDSMEGVQSGEDMYLNTNTPILLNGAAGPSNHSHHHNHNHSNVSNSSPLSSSSTSSSSSSSSASSSSISSSSSSSSSSLSVALAGPSTPSALGITPSPSVTPTLFAPPPPPPTISPPTTIPPAPPHTHTHMHTHAHTAHPPNPNPYPFPPWYPESAHFVRQWWPSLPSIPRVSCTVVLLAAHDQQTHRTRFVLAQHYFRVPLDHRAWEEGMGDEGFSHVLGNGDGGGIGGARQKQGLGQTQTQTQMGSSSSKSPSTVNGLANGTSHTGTGTRARGRTLEDAQDDALMHLWYVSTPFEVVRVYDNAAGGGGGGANGHADGGNGNGNGTGEGNGADGEGREGEGEGDPDPDPDDGGLTERPRPLVAVDFGHAVWIEYVDADADADADGDADEDDTEEEDEQQAQDDAQERRSHHHRSDGIASRHGNASGSNNADANAKGSTSAPTAASASGDSDPKWLRFVTFPPFSEEHGVELDRRGTEGEVRTLDVPPELDLGQVETINIDQSQGAVILSDKAGRIFILCYE